MYYQYMKKILFLFCLIQINLCWANKLFDDLPDKRWTMVLEGTYIFIPTNKERKKTRLSVWVLDTFDQPQDLDMSIWQLILSQGRREQFWSTKTLIEIDCIKLESKFVKTSFYGHPYGKDILLRTTRHEKTEFRYYPPNTRGGAVNEAACHIGFR